MQVGLALSAKKMTRDRRPAALSKIGDGQLLHIVTDKAVAKLCKRNFCVVQPIRLRENAPLREARWANFASPA